MSFTNFELTYSAAYFFICLLIGIGYAILLYSKRSSWGKLTNYFLATVRALLVAFICFLFLEPSVKSIVNTEEKPIAGLLIDNSASVAFFENEDSLIYKISSLRNKLEAKGYSCIVQDFDGNQYIDSIDFDNQFSPISTELKHLLKKYKNQNVNDLFVISDGIYNQGIAPHYVVSSVPVHTLAVGDSSQQKDAYVSSIRGNKRVYKGNKYPIEFTTNVHGYVDGNYKVTVLRDEKSVFDKAFTIESVDSRLTTSFYDVSDSVGTYRYDVKIEPLEGEVTLANNKRTVYVEVVEHKEKILILANAPHPDLKMLKSIFEKSDKFEVSIQIKSLNDPFKKDKYSLVVCHQYFSGKEFDYLKTENIPLFFIVTPQSNIGDFNQINSTLRITGVRGEDDVNAGVDPNFSKFTVPADISIFGDAPPVEVPFGTYQFKNQLLSTLMLQSVGPVTTNKPLFIINDKADRKEAVFIGNGLWRWRIFEYAYHENNVILDGLFLKTFELLSSKNDKRKFKVDLQNDEMFTTEHAVFEVEVFNELYENIYNQDIHFRVYSDSLSREYEFTNGELRNSFRAERLPEGKYRYEASVALADGQKVEKGRFVVKEVKQEELNLVANFNELRTLSSNTGGTFVKMSNDQSVNELVESLNPKVAITTEESRKGLNEFVIVFILLLLLLTIEWTLRKYHSEI